MVLVIDVMESPIERPSKGQKGFYSGKNKKHTLKTQVIIELTTMKIMCLRHGKGKVHDFKLFKKTKVRLTKTSTVLGDKGYQGILKIHENSATPIKKRTACAEVSERVKTEQATQRRKVNERTKKI